ncbi:MAG: hypothetical protein PHC34_05720 [Candidatus Gastranaerophilales bacterium]|nr:hypothetical protein [Candidatus Gastranaerophilales bacterium]
MPLQIKKKILKTQEHKVRYIIPKNNGEISSSITQNWTDQAIMCYSSGCNCTECSITQGNYSFVCQMPGVIKVLLEHVGPPDEERLQKILA